jgi:hypothetical protein
LFESLYEIEGRNLSRTIESLRTATARGGAPFAAVRAWVAKAKSNQLRAG